MDWENVAEDNERHNAKGLKYRVKLSKDSWESHTLCGHSRCVIGRLTNGPANGARIQKYRLTRNDSDRGVWKLTAAGIEADEASIEV
jgi:hypothetical protein